MYVSDLHLTDTGPSDDFAATAELSELLDSLRRHPGQGAGPRWRHPRPAPGRRLPRGAGGPGPGRPGRRADRRRPAAPGRPAGARVLYLVGNHDSTLAWDGAARKLVADRFGVTDFALHARSGSSGPTGRDEVIVVAEHGDALDRWNRRTDPFDPLDVPVGDHVVLEFVNRLESASGRYPQLALDEVDNVRPGCSSPGGWSRTSSTSSWAGPCATSPSPWCC